MVDSYNEASEKKHKFIQFVVIFWLLKLGWPLTNFENMKELFDILWRAPKHLARFKDESQVENIENVRSSRHAPWLSTL